MGTCHWAAGQTEAKVIHRVGQKIAARARELTRPDDTILILAGKGHNGDDARAAKKFWTTEKLSAERDGTKSGAGKISQVHITQEQSETRFQPVLTGKCLSHSHY